MDQKLLDICEQVVANRQVLKKSHCFENGNMAALAGFVLAAQDRDVDIKKLKKCARILKHSGGLFSCINGFCRTIFLVSMMQEDDPEAFLDKAQTAYDQLSDDILCSEDYLMLASLRIARRYSEDEIYTVAHRVCSAVNTLEDSYSWITNEDDLCMAVILTLVGRDVEKVKEDADQCFHFLRNSFSRVRFPHIDDGLQAASQVLSLSTMPAGEKCYKYIEIYKQMKKSNHAIHNDRAMMAYAAFVDLDAPTAELVESLAEVESWLRRQAGFKSMVGATPAIRRTFASAIVLNYYQRKAAGDIAVAVDELTQEVLTETLTSRLLMVMYMATRVMRLKNQEEEYGKLSKDRDLVAGLTKAVKKKSRK